MKREARHAEFKDRVRGWARRVRVQPSQIRVQRMSRKWASCSTRGWCTFAADLVEASRAFQDFVIVHELLHLKVRNHGRLFRSFMSAHLPGWRAFHKPGDPIACCVARREAG